MIEKAPSFTININYENSNLKIRIENIVGDFGCFIKVYLFLCKDLFIKRIETSKHFKSKQILLPGMKITLNINDLLLKNNDKLILILEIEEKKIAYSFEYCEEEENLKNEKELKFINKTEDILRKKAEEEKINKSMDSLESSIKSLSKSVFKHIKFIENLKKIEK